MQSKIKPLITAALMCAVLAVSAQIILPIGPVPFSMSIFGVALVGAILPPAWAAACLGCYLALGLVGVPVFAGFGAGPGVLFGLTGGYLVGYFALALAASCAARLQKPFAVQAGLALLGLLGCYLFGTLWYMLVTGGSFWSGLVVCVLPFALPDLIKLNAALALARLLGKRLAFTGGKTP